MPIIYAFYRKIRRRLPGWAPVCAQLLLELSPWMMQPLTPYLTPLWPVSVALLALAWGLLTREYCYPRPASEFRLQRRVFSLLFLCVKTRRATSVRNF
jgi:hypothetical protein